MIPQKSLAEAEHYAATQGIRLTATDRENIRKAQESELQRLTSLQLKRPSSGLTRLIEGFNKFYPRLLESLIGVGNILLTFTQTIIISFGVPIVLVLLLLVEQQRVVHGISLFETDPALAAFAAWALVMLNLVLEFQIHYIEHRENYHLQTNYRFSLRLWLQNAAYMLGIGSRWQSLPASPAQRYKSLLRLVTFSILALALAGSMRTVIAGIDGAWYLAIVSIFTESNLSLMLTWLGGLLFATAAVLAAQGLSRYVALRTVEVIANMASHLNSQEDEFSDALEAVAAQYVLAKVTAAQARQAEKDTVEVVSLSSPFSANGMEQHSPMG